MNKEKLNNFKTRYIGDNMDIEEIEERLCDLRNSAISGYEIDLLDELSKGIHNLYDKQQETIEQYKMDSIRDSEAIRYQNLALESQKTEVESEWILDTFENRPKLLEKVIIRIESKSGKINYEVSNTIYDEDDDLMWDIKNRYLGGVTHFKRFTCLDD